MRLGKMQKAMLFNMKANGGTQPHKPGDNGLIKFMARLTDLGLVKWSGNGICPHWYLTHEGNKHTIY